MKINYGKNDIIWIHLFKFFPIPKFIGTIRFCTKQGTKRKALWDVRALPPVIKTQ